MTADRRGQRSAAAWAMALTVGPQRTNPAARAALRHGSNTAKRTARSATAESWCT